MQLYINTVNNGFITDPLFKSPLTDLSFKRGDSATINIAFVSETGVLSAVSGKTLKFGIKQFGDYDGNYLVFSNEYTTSGTNYVLKPSFNTTNLNNLLSGDTPSVAGMLEVTWIDTTDEFSTNTLPVTINNDVNKFDNNPVVDIPDPVTWLGQNIIGLNTSPLDVVITQTDFSSYFDSIPYVLYPNNDFAWTSDGEIVAPEFGSWVWAGYETFPEQPTIYAYTVQYWSDQVLTHRWVQYTDIPAETVPSGVYQPFDAEVWPSINLVVKDQEVLDKHRFVTDGVSLFVNYSQVLSGAPASLWKTVFTGGLP
jgi:hypothetical protein